MVQVPQHNKFLEDLKYQEELDHKVFHHSREAIRYYRHEFPGLESEKLYSTHFMLYFNSTGRALQIQ